MPSIIQTDTLKDGSGTKTLADYSSNAWNWGTGLPSGSIVQVQFTQFGTHGGASQSSAMSGLSANNNYVLEATTSSPSTNGSATGILEVTITPRITGSKMWIQSQWFGELNQDTGHDCLFFYWRSVGGTHTKLHSSNTGGSPSVGETGIISPTRTYYDQHTGSTPDVCFMQYFDTHGESAGTSITYKLGFASGSGNFNSLFTNRTQSDDGECGISSLCVTELAP